MAFWDTVLCELHDAKGGVEKVYLDGQCPSRFIHVHPGIERDHEAVFCSRFAITLPIVSLSDAISTGLAM
jgi:hypothetical protein